MYSRNAGACVKFADDIHGIKYSYLWKAVEELRKNDATLFHSLIVYILVINFFVILLLNVKNIVWVFFFWL